MKKASLKQRAKTAAYSAIAGLTALYSTGCASMNYDIKPHVSMNSNSEEGLEGRIGLVVGGQESKESTGMKVWNTARGPFYVYRCKDGKWFPEWREHPIRTSIMTAVYAGTAYAISQSGGSGGSGSKTQDPAPEPAPTTPTRPTPNEPAPSNPSDGGSTSSSSSTSSTSSTSDSSSGASSSGSSSSGATSAASSTSF